MCVLIGILGSVIFNKKLIMVKKLNIKGLIAATFTPMTSDFSINLKVIDKYANYLKKNGVEGVFVSGTTGEGGLLNIDERKLVLQEWIKHKSKDFKIISHVGSSLQII